MFLFGYRLVVKWLSHSTNDFSFARLLLQFSSVCRCLDAVSCIWMLALPVVFKPPLVFTYRPMNEQCATQNKIKIRAIKCATPTLRMAAKLQSHCPFDLLPVCTIAALGRRIYYCLFVALPLCRTSRSNYKKQFLHKSQATNDSANGALFTVH